MEASTRSQRNKIEYVEQDYPRISLTAQQLLHPTYWQTTAGQTEIVSYLQLMEKQPLVIFETYSEQTTAEIVAYSEEMGLSAEACRFRIGEALGMLTKALWSQHQENTFLFTGGDTLFQSMKVLGVTGIKPLTEIKPGVFYLPSNGITKRCKFLRNQVVLGQKNYLKKLDGIND